MDDNEADTSGRTRRRKKPWRYRWPDDFRDEVLMRLLRLNQERAEQERNQAATTAPAAKSRRARNTKKNPTPNLPGMGDPG